MPDTNRKTCLISVVGHHQIMKSVLCTFVIVLMVSLSVPPCKAQQPPLTPSEATLNRSTTGRGIDSSGFASISVPLKKGGTYDVVRSVNGGVVLRVDGRDVLVPKGDVSVTEKAPASQPSANGFTPGKIVLISAKYTMQGNQPRNVKNRLQKLVPEGIITAPVEIIVTDALSLAVQAQGATIQGTATANSSTTATITLQMPPKNVLTVEYLFNGEKRTKQAPEGEKLVLP